MDDYTALPEGFRIEDLERVKFEIQCEGKSPTRRTVLLMIDRLLELEAKQKEGEG